MSVEDFNRIKRRIRSLDIEPDAVSETGVEESFAMLMHAILDEIMFMQNDSMPTRMLPRIVPRDAVTEPDA